MCEWVEERRGRSGAVFDSVCLYPALMCFGAIGDLHGDITKTRKLFQDVGLTDNDGNWCAGSTVVVQVGDQLDRGRHEIEVCLIVRL